VQQYFLYEAAKYQVDIIGGSEDIPVVSDKEHGNRHSRIRDITLGSINQTYLG